MSSYEIELHTNTISEYFQTFLEVLVYPALSDSSMLSKEWEYLRGILKTYPLDTNRIRMYFELVKEKAVSKKILVKGNSLNISETPSNRSNKMESPALMNTTSPFTPMGNLFGKSMGYDTLNFSANTSFTANQRTTPDYTENTQFGNYGISPGPGSENSKPTFNPDIFKKNEPSQYTYEKKEEDTRANSIYNDSKMIDFQKKNNFGISDDFGASKTRTHDMFTGGVFSDSNKILSNAANLRGVAQAQQELGNSKSAAAFDNVLQKFRDHDPELNIFLNISSNHLIGKGVSETMTPDQYYEKIMSKYRN